MSTLPRSNTPKTFWFTGLSGAGKTTLALALAEALAHSRIGHLLLDGDNVRRAATTKLGYSRMDRRTNIEYAANMCLQANRDGQHAIAAFISPYRDDRAMVRALIGASEFYEIYVATPLEICEARDPKGLYRRARKGEILNFTGIDDPYEFPCQPDLVLNTHELSVTQCVARLLALLDF